MFLTIAQKDLHRALSLVTPLVGNGQLQMPIVKHLLLCPEPDGLAVLAANDEMRVRVRVPAKVQALGTLLLAVQPFARLVGDLPPAEVTLLSPAPTDQTALHLRCQHITADFKLSALSTEEFPPVRFLEEGEELFTLDSELFKDLVEQVAFAAAADASRPVLEGVHVACAQGVATFRAADAFRLAMRAIPIPDHQASTELLIPVSVLRTLARLLPPSGAVRLGRSRDGRLLLVQTRNLDLSARLLEGTFPETQTLLTLEGTTRVVLPTGMLIDAIHVMSAFARENQRQLRCIVEVDALRLEAEAADLGKNEIRLCEEVTVSGPPLSLLLNHTYLAEALAAVPTAQVAVEYIDARHPVTIRPVGELVARHVIMPLVPNTVTPAPTPAPPEAATTRAAH